MEQQQIDAPSPIMDAIVQEEEENVQVNEKVRPQEEIVSRRSTREKRSAISNDYIVYALEHESDLSIDNDPVSFDQAMSGENSDKWLMAMKEELKSMDDNNVWEMTELPKDSKRVDCKWVFKTKRDSKGNVERYKVRLVAKGYTQKDGIYYKETFSPVSRKDSLRIVMAWWLILILSFTKWMLKRPFSMEIWKKRYIWINLKVLRPQVKEIWYVG